MRPVQTLVALVLFAAPADAEPPDWIVEHESVQRLLRPARTISIGLQFPNALGVLTPDLVSAVVTLATLETPSLKYRHPPELATFAADAEFGLTQETFDQLMSQSDRLLIDANDRSIVSQQSLDSFREAGVRFDLPTQEELDRARRLIAGATSFGWFMSARQAEPMSALAVVNLGSADRPGPINAIQMTKSFVLFDIGPFVAQPAGGEADGQDPYWAGRAHELLFAYARQMGLVRWERLDGETRARFTSTFWPDGDPPPVSDTAWHSPPSSPAIDFAGAFALALLYPETYERQPVLEFDVFRPWTNTPEPEALLGRIRFAGAILETDEREFTEGLRDYERKRRSPQRRSLLSPPPQ